ncbi:hypothetical protein EE612_050726 [Oryza sativa]|nr:hypothetical protein EE612_050726 [Oryza sativa]
MPDLGGDGDEAEKAPTLSPAAVACARGWMRRRRRTAAMASDGLGGAVPRSNPVTTVVLCPDPVAAGVPRLTSHGSTGGGGRRAAGGRPPCSPLLLFLFPLLPARCRHRGCPPPARCLAAAVCRWTSTLTRPPRASPPR